jgi:hypothetical protein
MTRSGQYVFDGIEGFIIAKRRIESEKGRFIWEYIL